MTCTLIQRLHASATTNVATAIAVTQMETSDAPVIMAINLTVMDKHVKVCSFIMRDNYCSYKSNNTVYYLIFLSLLYTTNYRYQ